MFENVRVLVQVIALEPKVPNRSDRAVVRLAPSGESVSVRCSELGEKHEADSRQRWASVPKYANLSLLAWSIGGFNARVVHGKCSSTSGR